MVIRNDTARIVTDAGVTLKMGRSQHLPYVIDPINGVDVTLQTSQGVSQEGENVDNQTVGGVYRTIQGIFWDGDAVAKKFLNSLHYDTTGTIYLYGKYSARFAMKKLPDPSNFSDDKLYFTMMIFCPSPFWESIKETSCSIGGYTAAFRFPINYKTPHRFSTANKTSVTVTNKGSRSAPFSATLTCEAAAVENPTITNLTTGEYLTLNTTMQPGDVVTIGRSAENVVTATLNRGGVERNIFGKLDEGGTFYKIAPGDNLLTVNSVRLRVELSFKALYSGVIPDAG
jgi:hypothetical protein